MTSGRKKGKWRKAPFGCDGAGRPIIPSPKAPDAVVNVAGDKNGGVVANTAATQQRLNKIIADMKAKESEDK